MKKLTPSRSVVVGICGLFLATFGLWQIGSTVFAEKSGSSPESGATSRIKTAYDWLVAKGTNYGATDASDWSNNWGSMWNRIMESAAWEPDGTAEASQVVSGETFYAGNGDRTIKTGTLTLSGNATTGDVATGKTFYSNSLTKLTGSAPPAFDYSTQSKVIWDDYKNGGSADGDNAGEESAWSNTAGTATTGVWKDSRTGLYWSNSQGFLSNSFTEATCDYFSTTPRGSYTGADGDCGNAINYCANLNLAAGGTSSTDWYLPSQKELMQAYLNGIYNQTNTTFATTSDFWSSAEASDNPANAWLVYLSHGSTGNYGKVNALSVRCVRRD